MGRAAGCRPPGGRCVSRSAWRRRSGSPPGTRPPTSPRTCGSVCGRWRSGAARSTTAGSRRCGRRGHTRPSGARLAAQLERGPAAHGFDDQRWTLKRIAVLIARLFGITYTEQGVWYLLRRHGVSCQVNGPGFGRGAESARTTSEHAHAQPRRSRPAELSFACSESRLSDRSRLVGVRLDTSAPVLGPTARRPVVAVVALAAGTLALLAMRYRGLVLQL
jgi:hypothetical protein